MSQVIIRQPFECGFPENWKTGQIMTVLWKPHSSCWDAGFYCNCGAVYFQSTSTWAVGVGVRGGDGAGGGENMAVHSTVKFSFLMEILE